MPSAVKFVNKKDGVVDEVWSSLALSSDLNSRPDVASEGPSTLHVLLEDSREPAFAVPLAEPLPPQAAHAAAGLVVGRRFA